MINFFLLFEKSSYLLLNCKLFDLQIAGMGLPGPSGIHQVANQDPNYGKCAKSTIRSHPFKRSRSPD